MGHHIKFGTKKYHLPKSRFARIIFGILLIIGGILGFLPILGFWMIPLGLLVLSVDIPAIRRGRRNLVLWWHQKRRQERKDQRNQDSSS